MIRIIFGTIVSLAIIHQTYAGEKSTGGEANPQKFEKLCENDLSPQDKGYYFVEAYTRYLELEKRLKAIPRSPTGRYKFSEAHLIECDLLVHKHRMRKSVEDSLRKLGSCPIYLNQNNAACGNSSPDTIGNQAGSEGKYEILPESSKYGSRIHLKHEIPRPPKQRTYRIDSGLLKIDFRAKR